MRDAVFATSHVTVYLGDALAVLRELPDASVDCVVTSPPYWGLRDYGVAGQIGLERTPPAFIAVMVEVFREVRRVLADRGTLWLNLGDSYASKPRGSDEGWEKSRLNNPGRSQKALRRGRNIISAYKPKDMIGVPWRVAFALQDDGWYLRSDIIWAKPNPMPESVTDRPTKAHEYLFLFAKSERYFYDADAIREPLVSSPSDLRKMIEGRDRIGGKTLRTDNPKLNASSLTALGRKRSVGNPAAAAEALARSGNKERKLGSPASTNDHRGTSFPWEETPGLGRNARTVWNIATTPYADAHFATFPEELPRRAIKAGTSDRGYCVTCGSAWIRVVERTLYDTIGLRTHVVDNRDLVAADAGDGASKRGIDGVVAGGAYAVETLGWKRSCEHKGAQRAGVVLDPFAGSGTTLAVARDLGRRAIGIELNPEYVRLIEKRCAQQAFDMVADAAVL